MLNWHNSRRYCLTLGADLPVILDSHTESSINRMLTRAGVSKEIHLGLHKHPVTSEFEWVDGSPLVYVRWNAVEPNGGECVCRYADTTWDNLDCLVHSRQVICQQSIEGMTIGLVCIICRLKCKVFSSKSSSILPK